MAIAENRDGGSAQSASQVLMFQLGAEPYCVSIDHVTDIVEVGDVTTIPNSPPHVEGVMDLRGNTTTIVNPKSLLDLDVESEGKRIVVFDPSLFEDRGSIGWIVDGVNEVARVLDEDVDDSSVEDECIRGIVKHDGTFVVWLKPRGLRE